ncbi:hypothetical protein HY346_03275 [Candidatus Microgenomates bacterium]|nr:hypothetical protein [Candidatus Microgenomates bacterium]
MAEMQYAQVLAEGKPNSSGRVQDVIDQVQARPQDLDKLFECIFNSDENVRLRAGDALEKVCRAQPEWLQPFIPRLLSEVTKIEQHSVQWHLAQMLGELHLDPKQQREAVNWLVKRLAAIDVDWIVAGYAMETLAKFAETNASLRPVLKRLLKIQQRHHSSAVARKATKLLEKLV